MQVFFEKIDHNAKYIQLAVLYSIFHVYVCLCVKIFQQKVEAKKMKFAITKQSY